MSVEASRPAASFEDPRLNRIFTTDSEWLFERVDVGPEHLVLDVAAGTGHVARSLADGARAVVAIDATTAMLETGRAQADAAGLRNLVWLRGDAAALPFLDGSFDVVVTRLALPPLRRSGGAARRDGPLRATRWAGSGG